VLATVFAVAAVAKLRDSRGSRRAALEFGVPVRLAPAVGIGLPLVELAIAAGLVAEPAAPIAALAAAALLVAFCLAIAANLARGRTPECNCFGRVHSAPAGWSTVARNVAFAAIALWVAGGMNEPKAAVALGVGATALLVPALAVAWRRAHRRKASEPLDKGLTVGTEAPAFPLLAELLVRGRPVLLLFTDRDCGPCRNLVPEVGDWRRQLAGQLEITVLENADELADAYGAMATPSGVLVGADGRIAAEAAAGRAAIEALVARAAPHFKPTAADARVAPGRAAGLRRRELIVRAGSAWAASSFMFAWPARAARDLRNGRRPCPKPSQLRCGGECISVLTDRRNCGTRCENLKRCRNILPGSPGYPEGYREVCAGGRCIRDTDGSRCTVARDEAGDRGLSNVPPNQCGGGLVCCEGQCVDPTRPPNCGGCGGTATGQRPACCEGARRDLQSDPRHCGRCFNRCPDDKPTCYAPPGTPMSDVCRKNCGDRLDRCSGKCYDPETELCCGDNVYTIASLHPDARCCDDQIEIRPPGSFFCP
jgi:hypothetical protein